MVAKKKVSDLTQWCLAILVGLFLMFLLSWDIDAWLSQPTHACWSYGADSVEVPWDFWLTRTPEPGKLWPELEPK